MMRKPEEPILENILKLFAKRVKEFTGDSHRSYQKAFSSFQIFALSNFPLNGRLIMPMVESWIVYLFIRGLSHNTIAFYLDKIASLYSGIARKLKGGREISFKQLKQGVKTLFASENYSSSIFNDCYHQILLHQKSTLLNTCLSEGFNEQWDTDPNLRLLWSCIALKAGVRADVVKWLVKDVPPQLKVLELCQPSDISHQEIKDAKKTVETFLYGEPLQWFAMRLRPKVTFESLLHRLALSAPYVKMPEFFYPCQEFAKLVGKKIVWKGRPVIRDIVFFRKRRSEIYPLLMIIYDLAWCYSNPGAGAAKYAAIPDKAIEDFKKSLGFLTPDFELAPQGELPLKPGDKVIVLNGRYMDEVGLITKKPSFDEDGNKIYRVTLMQGNSNWDIGIDARLLKKA